MTPPALLLYAVDASPLIGLAKIGRLDLLSVGARVQVTETVYQEVIAGDAGDPARRDLTDLSFGGWGQRTPDVAIPPALAAWGLDAGEEATLALALTSGAVAVLDDGDGRRAARALGIPLVGTVGLVLEGKRHGVVTSAADTLRELRAVNLFLPSDALLRAELALLGEAWP